VLIDLAVQAVHVTNQSMIYAARPEARSRLAGAYMVFYSVGIGGGSVASTATYAAAGWTAVCALGATISLAALAFWISSARGGLTALLEPVTHADDRVDRRQELMPEVGQLVLDRRRARGQDPALDNAFGRKPG
jgi:hypothetical protein